MSGRTRKPIEQRQGHREHRGFTVVAAPEIETIVPALPKELRRPLASTVERWNEYWQSPVAQIAMQSGGVDLGGLYRWITSVDEWTRAMRTFRMKRIVEGSMGQPTLNPLATYIASREAAIKAAEDAYGLTPMSRLKLGIAVGQAKLTAEELNRALELAPKVAAETDDADELAEWEEA